MSENAVGVDGAALVGPAEQAAWAAVAAEAERSGEYLDVPDFLDASRQSSVAIELLAAAWREPRPPVEAAPIPQVRKFTRRQRFRTATRRLRNKDSTFGAYLRTCLWITFKSQRAAPPPTNVPRPGSPKEPVLDPIAKVQQLLAAGQYDHAYVLARALTPDARDKKLLELIRRAQGKRGSISSVLAVLRRDYVLQGKKADLGIRKIEGRFRELSGWHPRLPGPRLDIVPAADNVILHLVKESRPYLSNGFTSRSHRNFVSERAAGLVPVVVTEPGFPRRNGIEDFEAVETIDDIVHHRLDMGLVETQDEPSDEWLERFATMALAKVQEIRPAAIHVSSGRRGYETALVGLALQEKTGLPLVYEVRSFFEGNWTGELEWEERGETFLRRRAVEIMCMERADAVITLGESMRNEIVGSGIAADKVSIVPNGVDVGAFDVIDRDPDLSEALGLAGRPTFGYVSNMDHYRESQETLVQACALLKERGSEMRCVLVGGGPRAETVKNLATKLGVADRVVFTGPVDHMDIPAYYSLIDFFVVPRIDERAARYVTPLKPFEAMAVHRPVIVSDLPALGEIVDAPRRGLTFVPGDAASLADVLQDCEHDPEPMAAKAKAAYEWILAERQWSHNGARYQVVFDAVISRWKSKYAG